ncbi:hypothetical protein K438DRAFT_672980 [Mycena galopus ATCC 62051]|nr:hypothetical protein K438DRAFT_672980 [Mycena galopus ATCC 62051]
MVFSASNRYNLVNFGHCDIASVVSTSQTCRYLHDLAFRKSVWLGLLDDLRERSIWDSASPPDLQSLGTDELVKLVKRLMTGPETRSPQHPGFRLEVSKEIILHPKFKHTPRGLGHVELLPSGRTVLVQRSGVLECWTSQKTDWCGGTLQCMCQAGFSVSRSSGLPQNELNKGDSLVVMVCQRNEDQRQRRCPGRHAPPSVICSCPSQHRLQLLLRRRHPRHNCCRASR